MESCNSLKLVETETELNEIMHLLEQNLKDTFMVYGAIFTRLRYGPLKKCRLKVFRAVDPSLSSFVCITPLSSSQKLGSFSATWDSKSIDNQALGKLLSSIPEFNWNTTFLFSCGNYSLKQQLVNTWIEKLVIANTVPMIEDKTFSDQGLRLTITPENIKIPSLHPNYFVRRLPSNAASTMLATWSYSFSETEEGLEERLSAYPAMGIYYKGFNKEELVSWSHQYICGIIGMTYTKPEHRKNGLGTVVTLTLAKLISDEGRVPTVLTEVENKLSVNFHKKIGFEITGNSALAIFNPVEY